jgi:hypothetical protein
MTERYGVVFSRVVEMWLAAHREHHVIFVRAPA